MRGGGGGGARFPAAADAAVDHGEEYGGGGASWEEGVGEKPVKAFPEAFPEPKGAGGGGGLFLDKVDVDAVDGERPTGAATPPRVACRCWETSLAAGRGRESGSRSREVGSGLLTRGNETLGDAERLDDSRRVTAFLFVFRSYLRSGYVDSVLAFRELVDLVKDHVENVKPLIEGVIGTMIVRIKVARTACSKMNERGG